MSVSDYLVERVAVSLNKEHPNLLYLADARLVARTALETLDALDRPVGSGIAGIGGCSVLQGDDGAKS
jgi:aryl-alcohol dehydrogenase-like predicted oxidoreductase